MQVGKYFLFSLDENYLSYVYVYADGQYLASRLFKNINSLSYKLTQLLITASLIFQQLIV